MSLSSGWPGSSSSCWPGVQGWSGSSGLAGWQTVRCVEGGVRGSGGNGRNMCLEIVENKAQAGNSVWWGNVNVKTHGVGEKKVQVSGMVKGTGCFSYEKDSYF